MNGVPASGRKTAVACGVRAFEDGAPYCALSSVDLMVEWPNFWRRHQGGASRRKREAELRVCALPRYQPDQVVWPVHLAMFILKHLGPEILVPEFQPLDVRQSDREEKLKRALMFDAD